MAAPISNSRSPQVELGRIFYISESDGNKSQGIDRLEVLIGVNMISEQRPQAALTLRAEEDRFPLISCIMPTYGRPDFVNESIAMFLSQDYPRKELLILNDCPEQIFECEIPGIEVFNFERRFNSLGEKRNMAIELSRGELIAIWDDDDVYLPWRLSFSLHEMCRLGLEFYRPESFWAYWGSEPLHENRSVPGWVSHGFVTFTKSLWKQVGGYPSRSLNEDSGFFDNIHQHLGQEFITSSIGESDRLFVLRGKSKYKHLSISGGMNPLDLTPGQYRLKPAPIADQELQNHVDELIQIHLRHKADQDVPKALISVCIAIKNRSRLSVGQDLLELFPRCVRALAKAAEQFKTQGDLELVVVDFQSDDWPLEDWLSREAGPLKIKVIKLEDRFSRGKGLNAAVQASTSDRVFLCDADMLVEPDAIQRAIEVIDSGRAWFPTYQCLDRAGAPQFWQDLSHGMSAFHRKLFEQAGQVPEFESWGGEDDLFHESLARLVPIVRERSPFLQHQWHPESSRHEHYANPRQSDFLRHRAESEQSSCSDGKPLRRFLAIHPYWCGEVHFYAQQRMARSGIDYGSYDLDAERLILNWDRWKPETLRWDDQSRSYRDPERGFELIEIFEEDFGDNEIIETQSPLVAVIGLHSSGSSCLAGVLHHLGLFFGNDCRGYYGSDPERLCGFESARLIAIMEQAMAFPGATAPKDDKKLIAHMHAFIRSLCAEAANLNTIPAVKYPLLCQAGPVLAKLPFADQRLIHIDRPLEDSIRSLQSREAGRFDPDVIAAHQTWLESGKRVLFDQAKQVLTVPYYSLLKDPDSEIKRIIDFLGINPSDGELSRASAYVNPVLRSV